jgi:hypothetical protein
MSPGSTHSLKSDRIGTVAAILSLGYAFEPPKLLHNSQGPGCA